MLPFWQRALRDCAVEDSYVVAIRNPRSVAASLFARQAMDADAAYRLWLAHMVPFFSDVIGKPFVVVDYDLLMRDSRWGNSKRVGRRLGVPFEAGDGRDRALRVRLPRCEPAAQPSSTPEDFDDGSAVARLDSRLLPPPLRARRGSGPAGRDPSLPADWARAPGPAEP